MGQVKQYSREYKEEALKLVEDKGCKNASDELGIPHVSSSIIKLKKTSIHSSRFILFVFLSILAVAMRNLSNIALPFVNTSVNI